MITSLSIGCATLPADRGDDRSQEALDLLRVPYSAAPSSSPKPKFASTIDSIAA